MRRDWSISKRVMFLALTPSILTMAVLITYFTYVRVADMDQSLAQRSMALARQLAQASEFGLFAGNHAMLQQLADAAQHEPNVSSVAIRDAQGVIVARSMTVDSGIDPSLRLVSAAPVFQSKLKISDFENAPIEPIPLSKIGEVTVEMSTKSTRQSQQQQGLVSLLLGLGGVIFAYLLALGLSRRVIQPIHALVRATTEIEHGYVQVWVPEKGDRELRVLAEAFNRMAQGINTTHQDLQAQVARATRDLHRQKDAAEAANIAKSRFLAAASHDLRQPMHAIALFTTALQRTVTQPKAKPLVTDLALAVDTMNALFDALLDMSRLDSGVMQAQIRSVPLQDIFAKIEAEFVPVALEDGVYFKVCPTSALVESDPLLLQRALSNLVANAIRYAPHGTAMLCARRCKTGVRVEIRDSGIGIAPEDHSAIFQEFQQVANKERDRSKGLGLGLAIVARIAPLIHASIDMRSALGEGSLFSLTLPRAAEAGDSSSTTAMNDEAVKSDLRIIVIDNDPLVLTASAALLNALGFVADILQSGDAAYGVLERLPPQSAVVLCDLWLPNNESGFDVLERLRKQAAFIGGVIISGDTRPEIMRSAHEAGYSMLHKPVAPAKLRSVLDLFARKAGESDQRKISEIP
jgi:two-component system, sensor histidine kinase